MNSNRVSEVTLGIEEEQLGFPPKLQSGFPLKLPTTNECATEVAIPLKKIKQFRLGCCPARSDN